MINIVINSPHPSQPGGPIQAVARVVGNVNGEEFGPTMLIANISSDQRGYSLVTAQMYNIPSTVGQCTILDTSA